MEEQNEGYLDLVVGGMFSGKTEHLIKIYNKFKNENKIFVINHDLDTRYDKNNIVSHNRNKIPINSKVSKLSQINLESIENFKIIIINESQFFPDLVEFVNYLLKKKKKIYISGLDGDHKQKKFGQIIDLIPKCDNIIKLKSVCNICNRKKGIFTKRIANYQQQILIGAGESYIPICRSCLDNTITS